MSASPQVTAGTICSDIPCQKCDYNLRGLAEDGRCPECGHLVAATLAFYAPEVRKAYTHWFASIRSGATRSCIATGCVLALPVVERLDHHALPVVLVPLLPCMLYLVFTGWFRLSAEPPVRRRLGFAEICRQVMTWSLLAGVLGSALVYSLRRPAFVAVPLILYQVGLLLYCGGIAGRLRAPVRRTLCYISAGATVCAWHTVLLRTGPRWDPSFFIAAMALATISLAAFVRLLPNPGRAAL